MDTELLVFLESQIRQCDDAMKMYADHLDLPKAKSMKDWFEGRRAGYIIVRNYLGA
jgi:hypothetical protein